MSTTDLTPEQLAFKEKIRSIQVPRKPFVKQTDARGSTQTYHHSSKRTPTGRIDCDIHPAPVRVEDQFRGVK